MPLYKFKARGSNGELQVNTLEADDPRHAAKILSKRGLIPISINATNSKDPNDDFWQQCQQWLALRNIDLADIALFSRQMYSLTKAGVPLIRAIGSLIESTRNTALAEALQNVSQKLESGSALSPALALHRNIFSPLFINIINVGESSGGLDRAFLQIAQYLEQEKDTRARITAALRYPSMVCIAIIIAIVIINIYVVPAFSRLFATIKAELPWQTKLLINVSDFSVHYWPLLIALTIAAVIAIRQYIGTTGGRLVWDKTLLQLPLVGNIVERALMERFCRTFAMTLNAGVPLIQGLSLVIDAIGNQYVASKLQNMRLGIEKGEPISRTARNSELFPPLVIQMLSVGEETGNIGEMLLEVADFYREEVNTDLKNLTGIIEPILLAFIGTIVTILALGIFLPLWDLSSHLKQA